MPPLPGARRQHAEQKLVWVVLAEETRWDFGAHDCYEDHLLGVARRQSTHGVFLLSEEILRRAPACVHAVFKIHLHLLEIVRRTLQSNHRSLN